MIPTLPYAEFYITNVCNLACPQCNRFNHLDFKGYYDFDPEVYQAWSKKFNLTRFGILGGEPTLHPNLGEWMKGVRQCWPNARGVLNTNGTHIARTPNLENLLIENNIEIHISFHNERTKEFLFDEIYKTFGYCEIKEDKNNGFILTNHRGVHVELVNALYFHQNALVDGKFKLHDSDPEKAHRTCYMKKCHHFIDGKLYKCGVVKLIPLLFEQYKQPVPELYNEYQPLQVTDEITQQHLDDLDNNSIPQCKFCPEKLIYNTNQVKFKNKRLNVEILNI